MVKPLTNPFVGRPAPLGTLLSAAGRRLAVELDAGLAAAGHRDLRSAHAPLFVVIEPEGSSVTELAGRAHMTKQAMGELVRHLRGHGYVDVTVDRTDRRVRRVTLTRRGWDALDVGVRVIEGFERWFDDSIGAGQATALRETLIRIITTPSPAWRPRPADGNDDAEEVDGQG